MLRALLTASIDDRPNDERNADLSAEHVRPVRGLVHDGIDREQHEIHSWMNDDWPHAGQRRADRRTGRRIFGDRCVDNPIAAKTAIEILHAGADVPRTP